MNITSYFIYDETSPSCLRWAEGATATGKGSAERKVGNVAGSLGNCGYAIQITENGSRIRTTAARVIWQLHYSDIPNGHYIAHLNGNSNDCRISNLICITHTTLQYLKAWNSNATNTRLLPSGRWSTVITIDRKKVSLGTYNTKTEADTIYRSALSKLLQQEGITLWNN